MLFWFPCSPFPATYPEWPGVVKLDRGSLRAFNSLLAGKDMSGPSQNSWLWVPYPNAIPTPHASVSLFLDLGQDIH